MAGNGGRMLAAAVVVCILVAAPPASEALQSCGQVVSYISSCVPYVRGAGVSPSPPCCGGVRTLLALAKTTPDRRLACTCLKNLGRSLPGFNPSRALNLPASCGVSPPFPISLSTDCTKVN